MSLLERLNMGLAKTRRQFRDSLSVLLHRNQFSAIEEQLEELLLLADLGPESTEAILNSVRAQNPPPGKVVATLRHALLALLDAGEARTSGRVIVLVGINGSGKTTTVGKLCHQWSSAGKTPFVIGCDTFRAAADKQLEIWCQRTKTQCLIGALGSDPASVVYDGLNSSAGKAADVVICDTAGRLHVNKNLMQELAKIVRIARNQAPHEVEVLLVLDAGTGQSAIDQFEAFAHWVEPTGIILTKLDGTAKGGVAVALVKKFGIPIRYLGVGETLDDLLPFSAQAYVDSLLPGGEQDV